jgi:hypothetical protein
MSEQTRERSWTNWLEDWLEDWLAATFRAAMSYTQRADIARCKSGSNRTLGKPEPSRGGNQCLNQCPVRQ